MISRMLVGIISTTLSLRCSVIGHLGIITKKKPLHGLGSCSQMSGDYPKQIFGQPYFVMTEVIFLKTMKQQKPGDNSQVLIPLRYYFLAVKTIFGRWLKPVPVDPVV